MNLIDYPYLLSALALLMLSGVGLICCRQQRKAVLISGLLSMPCSLTTFLFVPEYWNPVRLMRFPFGIEDILFSFSTGMLAWMSALVFHRDLCCRIAWPSVLARYGKLLLAAAPLIMVLRLTGAMIMTQALLGIIAVAAVLALKCRWLLPPALAAGTAFTVGYTIFVAIVLVTFPGFAVQWTHSNLSGLSLLGIPIEESLWALVFGVCWIITMGYVFDARPLTSKMA